MFWSLVQIIIVFGLLGFGVYYFTKKMKENQFSRTGEKGKIKIVDGVNLSYQTSTYLLEVDGNKVFVVVGQHGIDTTVLKSNKFDELLSGVEDVELEGDDNFETF